MELQALWFGQLFVFVTHFLSVCSKPHIPKDYEYQYRNCQPPSIIQKSKETLVHFRESEKEIHIPCVAKGEKPLTYTWFKDDEEIEFGREGAHVFKAAGVGSLVIEKAQKEDDGQYRCQVSNHCGTAQTPLVNLVFAVLDPFPPQKIEKVQVVLGGNAKLQCKPPKSAPEAMMGWIVLGDGRKKPVNLNERITMDYDGTLYITRAEKGDEAIGQKKYSCEAYNSITAMNAYSNGKKLEVSGNSPQNHGVEMMWHSSDVVVVEGETAKFKCIVSGYPKASVTWERVDGELDKSRSEIDQMFELIINKARYEDSGEYKCKGDNRLPGSSAEHTFSLKVQAAPKWKTDIGKGITVGVQESAIFDCDVEGDPKPEVQFYINGQPLDELEDNPRRTKMGNMLSFKDLQEDDTQVIQCSANNTHGSIWLDVYLYVQALPPSITEKPSEEAKTAEGNDLTLPCRVTGKPTPEIVWYKGDEILNNTKHFEITDEGDLIIKNPTKPADSGTYRCEAKNIYGKEEAEGSVLVRRNTVIKTPPVNLTLDYENEMNFTCEADTDEAEMVNLKYRWEKDGKNLKGDDRIILNGGTLKIVSTLSKDSGKYRCIAYNGLDSDSADADLKIKAVPEPPYSVKIDECNLKQAKVSWKFDEKMSNFKPMRFFIIQSATEFEKDKWIRETSVSADKKHVLIDLKPFAKYSFRVFAVNKLGKSLPSNVTKTKCLAPMGLPSKNPKGVKTVEDRTNYLVVQWEPLEQIDLHGPNFKYEVSYNEEGSEDVKTLEIDNYKTGMALIQVNNTYMPYEVSVRSKNQVGSCQEDPVSVTGYSGEAAPTVVPQNFELDPTVNVTATSATFMWDPVNTSPEVIQGKFNGYMIRFWKKGEKNTTMHKIMIPEDSSTRRRKRQSSDKVRGTVGNLLSYAEIEADVVVSNKNFQGPGSKVVNFSTPEGVPGPVAFLQALYRGSHHFLLQWEPPKQENGIITGYDLSYQRLIKEIDYGKVVDAYTDLPPEQRHAPLRDLEPDSMYRLYIWAKTQQGRGKVYNLELRTTGSVITIAKPVNIKVESAQHEANVTWTLLRAGKGSRHGQFYIIQLRKKGDEKWERHGEPIDGNTFTGELKHLDPGTQYEVRVIALAHRNDEDHTSASSSEVFVTDAGASKASFLTAAWFIGMMVCIIVLICILIVVCIIKRNRGDNYPVQEKERLRGNYDDQPDHFNGFGKGDDPIIGPSDSFDQEAEKVPLDLDSDSLDYGDDDGSKFNEDGSFIGLYGQGERGTDSTNASSIV